MHVHVHDLLDALTLNRAGTDSVDTDPRLPAKTDQVTFCHRGASTVINRK